MNEAHNGVSSSANSFKIHLTKLSVLADVILVAPFCITARMRSEPSNSPKFFKRKNTLGIECKTGEAAKGKKKNHADSIN